MTNVQSSINPATGEKIKDYPVHSEAQVEKALKDAQETFLEWRKTPFSRRVELLQNVSAVLLKNKDRYAKLIAEEMGKPFAQSIQEVEKCAGAARYFAENGPKFLADESVSTEYKKSYVTFQPIGIVLAVMPWNFPLWQVFRFALPALMAGNVGVLKHASNTPGCALAIEEVFREAGAPQGAFTALLIPSNRVEAVIANPLVRAVTLTGSTPAGRAVASAAGKHLKKTVLELGGSDPYLVLDDADIEKAIKVCSSSRLNNCGQSCISAKRLIVVQNVREQFEKGMVAAFSSQKLGNPMDKDVTVGPMSRADLRDEVHEQVQKSVKQGAKLLAGGKIPEGKDKKTGFYEPTVLTDVKKGMVAYEEEIFGPVAIIIPAKDEADAIRIANDSNFGLGGAVFSKDTERAEKIAREMIDTGSCFVNMMVRSDARLPFGGVKQSGYGRELAAFGIREFVNIKSVVVAKD